MYKRLLSFICILMITVLLPGGYVDAKAAPVLQVKKKTMYVGDTYKLKLKNVSNRAGVKWSSNKKSVVAIQKKSGNTVVLKAKNSGKATVIATYKKKNYKCSITVRKIEKPVEKNMDDEDYDEDEDLEALKGNPVMNETDVSLYFLPKKYKDVINYDETHLREFRFKVNDTKLEVEKWELVGEDKEYFEITEYGKVKLFGSPDFEEVEKKATVKATLEDGTVVTATVHVYDEVNIYLKKYFDDFIADNITDDMTELEKVQKVAEYIGVISDYESGDSDWVDIYLLNKGDCMASRWAVGVLCRYMGIKARECYRIEYHGKTLVKADGEFYMVVTGYDEPRPRSYSMWKVSEEELETVVKDNHIDLNYFE